MKHTDNNTLESTATDTNSQQPNKPKTTILYSDLTDDSPITAAKTICTGNNIKQTAKIIPLCHKFFLII